MRRVEAHRLVPQQRGEEGRRVVAPQPGRLVGQHGEGRRVALGEGVAAEGLQLSEHPLGRRGRHAPGHGPGDELLAKGGHPLGGPLVRERPPQQLRPPRCEPRQVAGHLQHLLLEHDHPQRLRQRVL